MKYEYGRSDWGWGGSYVPYPPDERGGWRLISVYGYQERDEPHLVGTWERVAEEPPAIAEDAEEPPF